MEENNKNQAPDNFENRPLYQKQKEGVYYPASVDLLNKISGMGIKVEIVEAQMFPAIYDEGEKVLRIRKGADEDQVNDYIENSILKEEDGIDKLDPNVDRSDYIKLGDEDEDDEDDEEDGDEKEGAKETEEEIVEVEGKNGEMIKIGDRVKWDFYGGVGSGEVVSFEKTGDSFFVNVNTMNANGLEVQIPAEEIFKDNPQDANGLKEEEQEQEEREENLPEWQKSDEWKEMIKRRRVAVKAQIYKSKYGLNPFSPIPFSPIKDGDLEQILLAEKNYEESKKEVELKIREILRFEMGENLSPEQESELLFKTNGILFDELVKNESDNYRKVLREENSKSKPGLLLEKAKKVLDTDVARWYLGLSKKQRMALSFGVGSIAGLSFASVGSSVGVASYLAWRAVRFGLSGFAGLKAGEWANKKWSIEELNEREEKEMENLKNSDLPLEEKEKGFKDIKEKYKKERIKFGLKKIGVTVGAGAGTGLLTGLAENIVMNSNFSGLSSAEGRGNKTDHFSNNRIGRGGFKTEDQLSLSKPKAPDLTEKPKVDLDAPPEKPKIDQVTYLEKPEVEDISRPEVKNLAEVGDGGVLEKTEASNQIKELFDNIEILSQEVKPGDSVWKILNRVMAENKDFRDISGVGTKEQILEQIEAKKTRIISALVNKVLEDPEKYGIGEDGKIMVGDKLDLSKLFEDREFLNKVMVDAQNMRPSQIASILENNKKIESWVINNPYKPVNVDEILNIKPRLDEINNLESEIVPKPENYPLPELASEKETSDLIESEQGNTLSEADKDRLRQEILEAKKRLEEIENTNNLSSNKSVMPDRLRTMMGDINLEEQINLAFRKEIDDIYGKNFFGLFKRDGINTKEWAFMSKLPANKVLDYYTGDSNNSGLSQNILDELLKSKKHKTFWNQIMGLMEQSKGAVKPYENENVSDFTRRLGGFIMKGFVKA